MIVKAIIGLVLWVAISAACGWYVGRILRWASTLPEE
jgi:hypothetical protein